VHLERKFARRCQLAQAIRRRKAGDSATNYRNPFDLWVGAR
jgi:hypothetical protein